MNYLIESEKNLLDSFFKDYRNDPLTIYGTSSFLEDNFFTNTLQSTKYDLIFESNLNFEEHIKTVETVPLNPGGMIIIENVLRDTVYIRRLRPIIHQFSDYYFVTLRKSKVLVLVKGGAEPIFKNRNKMTIITPSYRIKNLQKIKESMNFEYIHEWIIVYDGTKIENGFTFFADTPKIKEYVFKGSGLSGNPQRNFALDHVTEPNTLLYFLDDDNIVHPDLFRFMNTIIVQKIMYTFNQKNRLLGNKIIPGFIDTACILIDYSLCKDIRWDLEKITADGIYITDCYNRNKESYCYVNNNLCYYNKLS
jgi:hypothetical protein